MSLRPRAQPEFVKVYATQRPGVSLETHNLDYEFAAASLKTVRPGEQFAAAIGWSRTAVANYAALKAIDSEAWKIVTASQENVTTAEDDGVTVNVTGVTFASRVTRIN